jgi:hypothetical protein
MVRVERRQAEPLEVQFKCLHSRGFKGIFIVNVCPWNRIGPTHARRNFEKSSAPPFPCRTAEKLLYARSWSLASILSHPFFRIHFDFILRHTPRSSRRPVFFFQEFQPKFYMRFTFVSRVIHSTPFSSYVIQSP